jgi:plasmid stabilization system protein ParE
LFAIDKLLQEDPMARGDKSKYTGKQKRQAEHIEKGYEKRGVDQDEAERRAWATINKMTGGGKRRGGSGRGKATNKTPSRKGGHLGGEASAKRSAAARSASARKAAATRKRRRKSGGKKR